MHTVVSSTLRNSPQSWGTLRLSDLPSCNIKGEIYDSSGTFICKLVAQKPLGGGTFGQVDAFNRISPEGSTVVAIKRPKFHAMNLLTEALFQWKVYNDMEEFGLSFCIPQIHDIFLFQQSRDVWFSMEAFEPVFLSTWCAKPENHHVFHLVLLQIALILEVLENELRTDHRDLKINNIIVADEPTTINIEWNAQPRTIHFPFRIVFVDFGFACCSDVIDMKQEDMIPGLDPCPKEGRNMFQVLVSIWNDANLRKDLESSWGEWIRRRIMNIVPSVSNVDLLTQRFRTLDWMYTLTDTKEFRAPLCAPRKIIRDCMRILDRE